MTDIPAQLAGQSVHWRLAENDPTIVVTEALNDDGNCTVIADVLTVADARLIVRAPVLLYAVLDAAGYLASVFAQIGNPDSPEGWSDPDAYETYQVLMAALPEDKEIKL